MQYLIFIKYTNFIYTKFVIYYFLDVCFHFFKAVLLWMTTRWIYVAHIFKSSRYHGLILIFTGPFVNIYPIHWRIAFRLTRTQCACSSFCIQIIIKCWIGLFKAAARSRSKFGLLRVSCQTSKPNYDAFHFFALKEISCIFMGEWFRIMEIRKNLFLIFGKINMFVKCHIVISVTQNIVV